MTLTTKEPNAELTPDDLKMLWHAKNRGVLGRIGKQFGLSRTSVRRVFIGELQSGGRRVEKRLAELGCPGFEAYNGAHKDGAGRLDGR